MWVISVQMAPFSPGCYLLRSHGGRSNFGTRNVAPITMSDESSSCSEVMYGLHCPIKGNLNNTGIFIYLSTELTFLLFTVIVCIANRILGECSKV